MEIDFDATDPVSDFVTVPAGTYLCRVAEVRPGLTRAGDERWSLRLVIAEGEHVGKQAAWDGLVFSPRGRARARLVLGSLGLPASGKVTIEPGDLEGRQAFVQVRPSEYTSSAGETVRRNEVPYDGYAAVTDESAAERATDPPLEGPTDPPTDPPTDDEPPAPQRARRGTAPTIADEPPF